MSLNKRRREMVELLILKKIDLHQFANDLGVSTRTIRRELEIIELIVKDYNCRLVKVGNSYTIIGSEIDLSKIILDNPNVEYSIMENQIFLLVRLIDSPINLKKFIEDRYINSNQEKLLLSNLLSICDYENEILTLKNNERKIREVTSLLIMNLIMEVNYTKIYQDLSLEEVFVKKIFLALNQLFEVNQFNAIALEIVEVYKSHQLYIGEQELVYLAIILLVNKKRQDLGYIVDMEFKSFEGLANIIARIVKFDIKNHQYVVEQISKFTLEIENYPSNNILVGKIHKFFELIESTLKMSNFNLFELHANIMAHILRNFEITKTKLKFDNRLFVELVTKYQFIYVVIKEAALKSQLCFNEVEIVEIMIYYILYLEEIVTLKSWKILVICMGGMGTSLMIKNQIMQIFNDVIIENIPLSALGSVEIDNYDLIISNLEIEDVDDTIVVMPMLTSEDIHRIKQQLIYEQIGMRKVKINDEKLDSKNLTYKSIVLKGTKNTVLQTILATLENDKFIADKNYIFEKLLRREKYGIGIMNSKIAMYHTTSQSIIKPIIVIISTEKFSTVGFDQKEMICNTMLLILIPSLNSSDIMNKISYLSQLIIFDKKICEIIENREIEVLKEMIENEKSFN